MRCSFFSYQKHPNPEEMNRRKRTIRSITILILPFLFMVLINQSFKRINHKNSYTISGVNTLNPGEPDPDKCTWHCHNQTAYCKEHHVKYLKPYYFLTDIPYFGMITLLRSTGNYGLANTLILVVVIPLLTWYLFTKSLNIRDTINQLKHRR